jgi:predicted TIM-barrel fold metal-dependent hydrolase
VPYALSSDSHVMEPPGLWTGALGGDLADVAPRVEPGDDADWWVIGGQRMFSFSVATKAGLRFEGQDRLVVDYGFADVRPGAYLPDAHLADNEADGVWGSVLYPSVATMLWGLDDAAAVRRLARIYNDWLAEWCSHAPGRLKGVAILDVDDPATAVAELTRARERGLAGALIPVSPLAERPYDHPAYEPLWAAAADLGVPLSLHIATNRPPGEWRILWSQWGFQAADRFVRDSLSHMVFGGVFERHPALRVVSVEHEASWVPHFLDRIDETYTQRTPREPWHRFADGVRPSDFVRRHVVISFIEDRVGVAMRHEIGPDGLVWGSDYPHTESTFPRSRSILDTVLDGVPADERRRMTVDTTAALYGFDAVPSGDAPAGAASGSLVTGSNANANEFMQ